MNDADRTGRRSGPLRWGVLGTTAYISGLLIPAIDRTEGSVVAGVASRPSRAGAAAAIAERYGAVAHHDYASLVGDGDIDVVYIALPNTDHVEWTLQALAAGKHVLVEKPMAMTEKDCVRVEQAAQKAGRLAMEAFMYRFHPQQRRAAELLASGRIGELRVVRASFAFAIEDGSGNIRLERSLGGGATWDVGCYAMDVPSLFFGRAPKQVQGRFASRPGLDVETSAVGVMDFGEGRSAVVDYSIDYGPRAWYELQGSHGTISVRNAWAMGTEDGVVTVTTGGVVREEHVPAADHYQLQVAGFARAVLDGGPAPVPVSHSRRVARIGEALAASAAMEGAAVSTADGEHGTVTPDAGTTPWRP